ncbi:MAG: hypothetical protein AAFV53_07450 [Myxococcota bacterium]
MLWILLSLLACNNGSADSASTAISPNCGDGQLDDGEACDDGDANADAPDACRPDCQLPVCGDGIDDSDEDCDDGSPWGGDGCTPTCVVEDGVLEQEPNDAWDDAQAASLDQNHHGAITTEDATDCYTFSIEDCDAIQATLVGACPAQAVMNLHDPTGAVVATSVPTSDGCAMIDPEAAEGARFAPGGDWALCVGGQLDNPVPFYALDIAVIPGDDSGLVFDPATDLDQDGEPNRCDVDLDGDGIDNDEDNCPYFSNGPNTEPLTPNEEGFIRTWLTIGPFVDQSSADRCLPTESSRVAESDALAMPALGDAAPDDGQIWTARFLTENRYNMVPWYGNVEPPREAYIAVYLRAASEQAATFAAGLDDGARVWLDDVEILTVSSCQGINRDGFTAAVTLTGEWQRLMVKVYDQGGGWGSLVRFLDTAGAPITDLELALDPTPDWVPDQRDKDGDGVGDVCDDQP